ncbi:MAG: hypothetical protein QM662_08360 [Gordonia sp. (in: high G+C Gram-positive bacteria)]
MSGTDPSRLPEAPLPVGSHPVPDWVDARIDATLAQIRDEIAPAPRQPHRRHTAVLALVGAAAAIVAVVLLTRALTGPEAPDDARAHRPPTTTTSPDLGPPRAVALSVLGQTDAAPFGSVAELRRCTAANGVPAETPVVGSGAVTIDGTPRVVVLLATGRAGRFRALVVGRDCATGRPSTVSDTLIGGP